MTDRPTPPAPRTEAAELAADLAEAQREIARLQARLELHARRSAALAEGKGTSLWGPADFGDLPVSGGGQGGRGEPPGSGGPLRSIRRSFKMAGYALLPYNRRRKLKRRRMMAAIWGGW
jgi:hypothetical protein